MPSVPVILLSASRLSIFVDYPGELGCCAAVFKIPLAIYTLSLSFSYCHFISMPYRMVGVSSKYLMQPNKSHFDAVLCLSSTFPSLLYHY